jgi:hypothetical protein
MYHGHEQSAGKTRCCETRMFMTKCRFASRIYGTASVRTSGPGASIGQVRGRTIQMSERISRRSRCEVSDVANNFCDVAKNFSRVANRGACNIQRVHVASVLRTCCKHVANAVTCNIQHQESFSPPSCCDYITNMLRPVLRATSNIKSSPLSSSTQNPTSHVCNIETQHPQYLPNHSETLRCICRNMLE